MYKSIVRPLMFALSKKDPERAHEWAIALLRQFGKARWLARAAAKLMTVQDSVEVLGIRFSNRVGLAAGFDKDARAVWGFYALGFGFLEVGTVTAQGQLGNDRPRIWRFPEDQALINAMGFNNYGAEAMAHSLSSAGKLPIPIGISIGKNKSVPPEDIEAVVATHQFCLRTLYSYGDYFVVNVSSPNTQGLRGLQDKKPLTVLLTELSKLVELLASMHSCRPKHLLVKIAPDLTPEALDDVLLVCSDCNVCGIVATNTTLDRGELSSPTTVAGGLSGRPLTKKARSVVQYIRQHAPKLVIIGVGGILSADDAKHMIDVGADLVQIHTGFVYEGPFFPRRVARGLKQR